MTIRLTKWLSYTAGAAVLGIALPNCGSVPVAEDIATVSNAVLGPTTWDISCHASDIPELQRAFALGQVAANSRAFAECIETSLTTFNDGGLGLTIGPYIRCSGDRPNVTAGTILDDVRTWNPTTIACDYSLIDTSNAGNASIGSIDLANSSTTESFNLGSVLAYVAGASGPCFFNPGNPNCAPGVNYAATADVIFHEIMHQHGYNHVEGDNLCGIPSSQNPAYGNSIPYIVNECLFGVMAGSDSKCPSMYTGCGEGLSLVDSVYATTPTCSCVQAPLRSNVGSPRISAVTQSSINDYFALDGNRAVNWNHWTASTGFAGWTSLGGTFVGTPVAVAGAHGAGTIDVFAQGTNGGYFHKSRTGSTWSNWEALAGTFIGPPAVASWGANRIDVFGQGTDRNFYHQAWIGTATPQWQSLEHVGGIFNGPPTAVARGVAVLDLLGRGTDNRYYHKSYNGTSFSPAGASLWDKVGAGIFVTDPVVAATSSRLDIFGQGTDMRYYHQAGLNQTLESLGTGTYIGAPAAAWQTSTRLDVVGQGTNNGYFHLQQLNGVWSTLENLGITGFGGGTMLVPSPGDLNLYIEGTDHRAYFKDLRGTAWSVVLLIPGGSLD